MAAFTYHHPPFLVDSVSMPNYPLKTPKLFDEFIPNSNQFHPNSWNQPLIHQEGSLLDASAHDSSCVEQQSINTEKQRTYQSLLSMADKATSGENFTRNSAPLDNKRKSRNGSSSNSANSKGVKQVKCKKQKGDKENVKNDRDHRNQATEEPPKGYIHVRARRGQATDSHSLAERVRREKISEKMKMLQALVPGCAKVTGKALMLDEIINYVQSLQDQVELLSMKLASFDPMVYTFGLMDLDPMAFLAQGMNNSMGLPMAPLTQSVTTSATSSSTAQPLTFGDTNTITSSTTSTTATATFPCPLVDTSTCLLQQEQKENVTPLQEGRSSYCGVLDDQQRLQSIINQFGFGANLLYSLQ